MYLKNTKSKLSIRGLIVFEILRDTSSQSDERRPQSKIRKYHTRESQLRSVQLYKRFLYATSNNVSQSVSSD